MIRHPNTLRRSNGLQLFALILATSLSSSVLLGSVIPAHAGSGSGSSGSGSSGSSGSSGNGGGNSGSGEGGNGDGIGGDHGKGNARDAMKHGEVLPLSRILASVHQSQPGDVVGVNLHRSGSAWVYDVKVLGQNGQVVVVQVDARTAVNLGMGGS